MRRYLLINADAMRGAYAVSRRHGVPVVLMRCCAARLRSLSRHASMPDIFALTPRLYRHCFILRHVHLLSFFFSMSSICLIPFRLLHFLQSMPMLLFFH